MAHTSARSLLMTVLGEYVLPRQEPVWTSSLVDALALFKVEEKSARQALARASGEGWLKSERAGRRVRWLLTPPGRRLLSEGAERIYGFGRQTGEWDRTWLVLLVSVPESQRDLRHRMRTRLSWAGFGSPAPGVWISPNVGAEPEAARLVAELTDGGQAMSFVASYAEIGDEQQMVARAWDLRELEHHYERFIDEFTGLAPRSGEAVLLAQTRLVHEWRRFPFLDPDLPRNLLPDRWSGTQAAELFHARHAEWRDEAQQHWDSFVESGD
ncbi:PaaX family transcriptional regulator C-terminal domain-containing protein [Amycolatopsis sp. NPDC049253]|uniref:PaaX family transcriptional regulator n=1 Tax=Amycolatopsis sp. NPDC049253 TaxID=3155274 RepID=UPI00341434FF